MLEGPQALLQEGVSDAALTASSNQNPGKLKSTNRLT